MTQINLSTKQKQTHRHREQTCSCQGAGGLEEGWSERWRSADVVLHIEWINKVLLYSTENYIQHPMINHNGNEYFKKNVHTYICITESLLLYSRN